MALYSMVAYERVFFSHTYPPMRAWGLSRECALRIPSVIVKGDKMGRCVGITV